MLTSLAGRLALPAVLLAACSYDGSGLASLGEPTSTSSSTSTTTTSGPTTEATTTPPTTGPDLTTSTTTGTTAPVDPTEPLTGTVTTEDPSTTTTTGDATTTSSTTDPSTTSTSTGDETTGPPPPMLIDDGLVVRYFLDEAGSGQSPTHALDAAPAPLDLPLVYANQGGMNPVYVETGGHRGLRWPMAGQDGRATIAVAGTKVQARVDNNTAATIEVVVEVDGVTDLGSRISHVGRGADPGHFTLRTSDINRLEFYWKGNVLAGVWPVDWVALGRVVVHVVVDTGQQDPIHRVRLYVNGDSVTDGMDGALVHPGQNEPIVIPTDNNTPLHYTLGNRGVDVDRSFQGTLFYAAIYDEALSEDQLKENAMLLAAADDTP